MLDRCPDDQVQRDRHDHQPEQEEEEEDWEIEHGGKHTRLRYRHLGCTPVRSWLRRLDDDAVSGALWRRPVFYVPLDLSIGALLGVTLGSGSGAGFALTRPSTSTRSGPDGSPVEVANDYAAVPIIGGLVGAVLGLVSGGLLAVRRWRRSE